MFCISQICDVIGIVAEEHLHAVYNSANCSLSGMIANLCHMSAILVKLGLLSYHVDPQAQGSALILSQLISKQDVLQHFKWSLLTFKKKSTAYMGREGITNEMERDTSDRHVLCTLHVANVGFDLTRQEQTVIQDLERYCIDPMGGQK